MEKITILRPSDFHLHFRDDDYLSLTVPHTADLHYGMAMPNLAPPVKTTEMALNYRERILKYRPTTSPHFQPLMSLYLKEDTTTDEVKKVAEDSRILGFKLYPNGVTTQSQEGINDFTSIYPTLEKLEELGVPLMIHGEVPDLDCDIFDREKVFIEKILTPLIKKFPKLKITLEHITTQDGVDFVNSTPNNISATITPHHLYLNRNDMLVGGIKPHYYCMPIVKRKKHQLALIEAVLSGSPNFFLGTDSAPHTQATKETSCGCAGIYTAPISIALYLEIFYQHQKLDLFENFSSRFGCEHYELPLSTEKITLERVETAVPHDYVYGNNGDRLIPFKNGESVPWKIL